MVGRFHVCLWVQRWGHVFKPLELHSYFNVLGLDRQGSLY